MKNKCQSICNYLNQPTINRHINKHKIISTLVACALAILILGGCKDKENTNNITKKTGDIQAVPAKQVSGKPLSKQNSSNKQSHKQKLSPEIQSMQSELQQALKEELERENINTTATNK